MLPDQINRAIAAARKREADGYFAKVKAGDQKAASLFTRLVAYDLNPSGSGMGYGWLTKQPGETNVDGWSEDALVWSDDPSDFHNVVDLINGAGAPGASIGGAAKPRRVGNQWATPRALTADEMSYLKAGVQLPPAPSLPPYPGDPVFDEIGVVLFGDYAQAGQSPNVGMSRWFGRTTYDYLAGMPMADSLKKHRAEWRAVLGLPPL